MAQVLAGPRCGTVLVIDQRDAVGGAGESKGDDVTDNNVSGNNHEESANNKPQWRMAFALDKDLLHGTSSRCATFTSNPLIDKSDHERSEVFEIMNMEIWVGLHVALLILT